MKWAVFFVRTAVVAGLFVLASRATDAQKFSPNDPLEHGLGLILDTEEDLAGIPRTSEYRAFLPERIDLSDRFPVPGEVVPFSGTELPLAKMDFGFDHAANFSWVACVA